MNKEIIIDKIFELRLKKAKTQEELDLTSDQNKEFLLQSKLKVIQGELHKSRIGYARCCSKKMKRKKEGKNDKH